MDFVRIKDNMGAGDTFQGDILPYTKVAASELSGGRKNFCFPPLLDELELKSKVPSLCESCAKKATHDPAEKVFFTPPPEFPPEHYIAPQYRILTEDNLRLVNAVFILSRIFYGVENRNLLYNRDWTADNVSQAQTYEILQTQLDDPNLNQNQLRLYGPNPKCLEQGVSSINPDWIGNGGDEGNRLNLDSAYHHLPVGAIGTFEFPSCLQHKNSPWIEKIEDVGEGSNCEFTVTLSKNCSYAKYPIDQIYGEGLKYKITFWYYRNAPESWAFIQPTPTVLWGRSKFTLEPGDLTGGKWSISRRVLYPGLVDTGSLVPFSCVLYNSTQKRNITWSEITVITNQSPSGWEVEFDFSSVISEGFDKIEMYIFLVCGDDDYPCFYTRCRCAHSRKDWSGSYTHDSECYCNARIGADGKERPEISAAFANFRDDCFQPGVCPYFTLEPAGSCVTGDDLNRLWTAVSLILIQGLPGCAHYSNFTFSMINNPSLHLMAGFFNTEVSSGIGHPKRQLWFDAVCGQREAGEASQFLRKGAFWGRDGNGYEFDMANMLNAKEGLFPAQVPGYKTKSTPDGGTYDDSNDLTKALRLYPYRNIGNVHLHDYTTGNHGYCRTQNRQDDSESVIVGIYQKSKLTPAKQAEVDEIRGLLS